MLPSACSSCRTVLRNRLHTQILTLQSLRRSYHPTSPRSAFNPKAPDLESWYWETTPPTENQLAAASKFFRTHRPRKLWTATEWRKQNAECNETLTPEVAFLGRSNVGKSSLLNAILGSPKLNHVGKRPGKTTTIHAWGLSAADPVTGGAVKGTGGDLDIKLAVLDMPGYGYASHGDWGDEIVKYIQRRKQLRRVFLMLDSGHGVKKADEQMLELLQSEGIPHQIIASKCDRLGSGKDFARQAGNSFHEMRRFLEAKKGVPNRVMSMGEIIAVGALGDGRKNGKVRKQDMQGVEDVQWAVLRATGLDDFVMKKLDSNSTPSSPLPTFDPVVKRGDAAQNAADRIIQQALADITTMKPPKNSTGRSTTHRSRPSAAPARLLSRNPSGSSRFATSSDATNNDHLSSTALSRRPGSPSGEGAKWVPNVGGLAELLEMNVDQKKTLQAQYEKLDGRASQRRPSRISSQNRGRSRGDKVSQRLKA